MMTDNRPTQAALATLIVLQGIMLGSLYAGVAPHPPATTPIFGIGPFLGASIAAAVAALVLGPLDSWAGRTLTGLAAVAALISFGPQKYFDAQFPLIWPAVLSAQAAAVTVFVALIGAFRSQIRGKYHVS